MKCNLKKFLIFFFLMGFALSGCALNFEGLRYKRAEVESLDEPSDEKKPDSYFQVRNPYEGSLWVPHNSRAFLFGDNKASNINDILTINIMEQADASRDSSTKLSRKDGMKSALTKFFGSDLTFGLSNLWGKDTGAATAAQRIDRPFKPEIESSTQNTYDGSGSTSTKDQLIATITAKVSDVYPNGNLFIEGRREVTINNEKQIIKLSGIVRPEDISPNNVVVSTVIADAKISIAGKGVISDKQKPGTTHRLFDFFWPF